MNTDHCLVERDGPILTVTLNRPEAKNALSPGMLLGMYKAWRLLDSDEALRVAILTGRHMTAREALACGLVGRLVPRGEALAEAMRVAQEVCETASLSIKALMKMLREIDGSFSEASALARELEIGQPVFATNDAREGPRAFSQKRKPVFTGS